MIANLKAAPAKILQPVNVVSIVTGYSFGRMLPAAGQGPYGFSSAKAEVCQLGIDRPNGIYFARSVSSKIVKAKLLLSG